MPLIFSYISDKSVCGTAGGARAVEKMPTINTGELWIGDAHSPKSAAGEIEGAGNPSARLGQAEQLVKDLEPEPASPDAERDREAERQRDRDRDAESVPPSQQIEPGGGATQMATEEQASIATEQEVESEPDAEQEAEQQAEAEAEAEAPAPVPEPERGLDEPAVEQEAAQEAEQEAEQEVAAEPEPEPAAELAPNSQPEP